jgi:hypothetical protein
MTEEEGKWVLFAHMFGHSKHDRSFYVNFKGFFFPLDGMEGTWIQSLPVAISYYCSAFRHKAHIVYI